ncbi:hypothetical protein [Dokdonia sp. Hel_I_53]|uniref:hypothetical protein n=1 Tax=Dokdonia sp. Hel_I_53 TaxID=1566287 RepID=UPI001199DC00|nr:hypothetical protein [Dokdonia sp. Hel_I_53]TVZ50907.1 hypothetical protein OD90_0039 [Dokdonia sp. Hel_I_53]
MKILYVFIVLILNFQNSCTQEKVANINLSYTAQTRGFNYEIAVKNDTLYYTNSVENIRDAAQVLSEEKSRKLNSLLKSINTSSLETLERPSTGSISDRAPIAKLSLMKQGKEYITPEFDHGNPPEEIENLIDYLQQLVE